MKRIYLLLLLFVAVAGNVFAQRKSDLQLLSTMATHDTIYFNSASNGGAKTGHIVTYAIVNHGPDKVEQTDTIKMRIQYAGYPTPSPIAKRNFNLYFNAQVPGIPAGDTVTYKDTLWFSAPYATPGTTFQWCDSIWGKTQGGTIAWDEGGASKLTNNRWCTNTKFVQDPASVEDINNIAAGVFEVYPNPASSSINFNYDFGVLPTTSHVVVRDMMGRTVYSESLSNISGKQKRTIDVSSLSNGLYFVELSVNDQKQVSKVNIIK